MTDVVSVEAQLGAARDALAGGALVCIPTETTYGLAADIRSPAALAALAALKGRDARAPFALIAADVAQAASVASVWPDAAAALAAQFWPGPLTLVVPAAPALPAMLIGPGGGVGVRVSSHPWPVRLAAAVGAPITATSANPSGADPALTIAQARNYFGDRVAVYLDAGPATDLVASTVVALERDGHWTLLRSGPVDVSSALATTLRR